MKRRRPQHADEHERAGLNRYLEPSATLLKVLERNAARASEAALQARLRDAIERLKAGRSC